MLKPKYRTITEAVADFNGLLGDMDVRHPKDPAQLEKRAVAEGKKLAKQLKEDFNRHTNVTTKGPTSPPLAMLEHAPLSRYSSNSAALQSFRVLAGLDESVKMPWDSGASGSTKHVRGVLSEMGIPGNMGAPAQGGGDSMDTEDAAEPEAAPAHEPNHIAYGKKLSKDALAKSYFFRHNKHEMPHEARLKSHDHLAQHHGQVAADLSKLSDSAMKRGDRHGGIALKHMQRMHHEIGTLHTQKKHHHMFESRNGASVDTALLEFWPIVARAVGSYALGKVADWAKGKADKAISGMHDKISGKMGVKPAAPAMGAKPAAPPAPAAAPKQVSPAGEEDEDEEYEEEFDSASA